MGSPEQEFPANPGRTPYQRLFSWTFFIRAATIPVEPARPCDARYPPIIMMNHESLVTGLLLKISPMTYEYKQPADHDKEKFFRST